MRYISDSSLEKAAEIFGRIGKDNYYSVSGYVWTDEETSSPMDVNVRLSDAEIDFLDGLLSESDVPPLYDLSEEIPFYRRLCPEVYMGEFVPETIDTVHKVHFYTFTCMTVDRTKGTAEERRVSLCLSDEECIGLLAWRLDNRDASFNTMASHNPELHARLMSMMAVCLGAPEMGIPSDEPFIVFPDCLDEFIREAGE